MKTLIETFKNLAQIDSVSGQEQEIANHIVHELTTLGITPIKDEFNNVYARIGNKQNPTLFCAHMDTVEPGRGVQVIEVDGVLKSKGNTIIGGDNKASVALIMFTLSKLIQEKRELNIEVLFTVREETNSGISQFDTSRLESKVAFIFDGGDGNIGWLAKSAPTIQDFKIKINGKSSHASLPEDGNNVLNVLFNLKDKLKLGRPDEFTTLNIGILKAGIATNSVPGELTIEGDLRSSKTENFETHKNEFESTIVSAAKENKMEIEFNWIPYAYGYEMNLDSPKFEQIKQIYSQHNVEINAEDVKGGSDAAFLNYKGIEAYCLGDSVVDVHTVNERITISKFEHLQQIVESLFLKSF